MPDANAAAEDAAAEDAAAEEAAAEEAAVRAKEAAVRDLLAAAGPPRGWLSQVELNSVLQYAKKLASADFHTLGALQEGTFEDFTDKLKISLGAARLLKRAFAGRVLFEGATADMLVGASDEGLNAVPKHLQVLREDTCFITIIRCALFGFQLLKSLPRSGKTSLLQLLVHLALKGSLGNFEDAVYLSMTGLGEENFTVYFERKTGRKWRSWTSRASGGAPPGLKLLVVDEIQAAYGKPTQLHELLQYMKDVAGGQQLQGDTAGPARIVLASVHGDAPSLGPSNASSKNATTPFAYGPEHLVQLLATSDDGPLADGELLRYATDAAAAAKGTDEGAKEFYRDFLKRHAPSVAFITAEANTYWQRFWDDEVRNTAFHMVGPSVQEHLLWVTSGQIGAMHTIKQAVRQRAKALQSRGENLTGAGDRQYLNLFRTGEIYNALAGQREFMKEGLERGSPKWTLFDRLLKADAVEGCPRVVTDDPLTDAENEVLQMMKCRGYLNVTVTHFAFWTPLHYLYYRHMATNAKLAAVHQAFRPETMLKFLKLCVERMSAYQLRTILSRRRDSQALLERALQVEFYRVSYDLVPKGARIDADVNKAPGSGFVDFWISGVDWAVELLCDGIDLKEHLQRFEPNGKYGMMGYKQHAVVDFMSDAGPLPKKSRPTPCYHVIFGPEYQQARCVNHKRKKQWRVDLLGDGDEALGSMLNAARLTEDALIPTQQQPAGRQQQPAERQQQPAERRRRR